MAAGSRREQRRPARRRGGPPRRGAVGVVSLADLRAAGLSPTPSRAGAPRPPPSAPSGRLCRRPSRSDARRPLAGRGEGMRTAVRAQPRLWPRCCSTLVPARIVIPRSRWPRPAPRCSRGVRVHRSSARPARRHAPPWHPGHDAGADAARSRREAGGRGAAADRPRGAVRTGCTVEQSATCSTASAAAGRPGTGSFRRHRPGPTSSELEDAVLDLVLAGGFARPDVNVPLSSPGVASSPTSAGLSPPHRRGRRRPLARGSAHARTTPSGRRSSSAHGERVLRVTWEQAGAARETLARIEAAGVPRARVSGPRHRVEPAEPDDRGTLCRVRPACRHVVDAPPRARTARAASVEFVPDSATRSTHAAGGGVSARVPAARCRAVLPLLAWVLRSGRSTRVPSRQGRIRFHGDPRDIA